jgi:hypothetical protein
VLVPALLREVKVSSGSGGETTSNLESGTGAVGVNFRNESTFDRSVRIVAGLGLITLVFVGPQSLWGWVGIVPLATGLAGWCPAYSLFGFRTCRDG